MTEQNEKEETGSNANLRAGDKRSVVSLLQSEDKFRTKGGGRRLGIFCLEEDGSNLSGGTEGGSKHFNICDLNGLLNQVDTFCIQLNLKSGSPEPEGNISETGSVPEVDRKRSNTKPLETGSAAEVDRKRKLKNVQETGSTTEVDPKRSKTKALETGSITEVDRRRSQTGNSGSQTPGVSETTFSDKLRDVEDPWRLSLSEIRLLNKSDKVQLPTEEELVHMARSFNCQGPGDLLQRICAELDGPQMDQSLFSRSRSKTIEVPMEIEPETQRNEPRGMILADKQAARQDRAHVKPGETSLMETIHENEIESAQDLSVPTRSSRRKINNEVMSGINQKVGVTKSHASRSSRKSNQVGKTSKDRLHQTSSRSRSRGQRENGSVGVRLSSNSSRSRGKITELKKSKNRRNYPHSSSRRHEETGELELSSAERPSIHKRTPHSSGSRGLKPVETKNGHLERSRGKKLETQHDEVVSHVSDADVDPSDHSVISRSRGQKPVKSRDRHSENSLGKKLEDQHVGLISYMSNDDIETDNFSNFSDVYALSGHSISGENAEQKGLPAEGFEELSKLEQSVNEIGNLLRACYETIGGNSSKLTGRQVKALLKCSPVANSNDSHLHKYSAATTAHCTGCFRNLNSSKSRDSHSVDSDTLRDTAASRTNSKTTTRSKNSNRVHSAHSAGTFESHKERLNFKRDEDLFGGSSRPSRSKVKIIDSKPSKHSESLSKGSSRHRSSHEELSEHPSSVKTFVSSRSSGHSNGKAYGTRFIGVIEEYGSDEDDTTQERRHSMGSNEFDETTGVEERSFSDVAMEVDDETSDPGVASHSQASASSNRPSVRISHGARGRRGALTPHDAATAVHGARGVAPASSTSCADPKRHRAFQRRIDGLKRTIRELQAELCSEQNNWREELQAMQETVSNYEKLGILFHEFL